MNCNQIRELLPDLAAGMEASTPEISKHIASCEMCSIHLQELQKTMALLDEWQAPEPSSYFDQKLAVRLREEQALAPAGWLERLKSRFLFNTGRQFRPALAGALALVLVVGGGTFADLSLFSHPRVEASATVQDLQILDKNDQAFQTMDQLLQDDGSPDDGAAAPPTT